MKKSTRQQIEDAKNLLVSLGIIPVFWSLTDIIETAKQLDSPKNISINQAQEIADLITRHHDAEIGINWTVIKDFINIYFE